jgi:hypothetical protein
MILVAHKATDASMLGMAQWLFSLVWMTDDKDGVRETWGKVENLRSQTRCKPNRIALHGARDGARDRPGPRPRSDPACWIWLTSSTSRSP